MCQVIFLSLKAFKIISSSPLLKFQMIYPGVGLFLFIMLVFMSFKDFLFWADDCLLISGDLWLMVYISIGKLVQISFVYGLIDLLIQRTIFLNVRYDCTLLVKCKGPIDLDF